MTVDDVSRVSRQFLVLVQVSCVPEHESTQGAVLPAVFDHAVQLVVVSVAGAGGIGTGRGSNQDLDFLVCGRGASPAVPLAEVEAALVATGKRVHVAFRVVVELHEDGVQRHLFEEVGHVLVHERALRSGSQEVLAIGFVHELAQVSSEHFDLRHGFLGLKVEAVNSSVAKGTVLSVERSLRAKHLPDHLSVLLGLELTVKSLLVGAGPADGEQNGLALVLAVLDLRSVTYV